MTKHILMVFAGACSFGILSTFVKLAYREGYAAAEISVSQAFTGMLVLWLWVWLRSKKQHTSLSLQPIRSCWWQVLLTGAAIGLTTFLYYVSVHYIPASIAIILLMQFTWMGVLLDRIFFKKKADAIQLITIVIILTGTIMASGMDKTQMDGAFIKGCLYALASAFLYALYVVANSRYGNALPAPQKSALIMTGSTLGILIVNFQQLSVSHHFDTGLIKWALFLAVFGTIIPPVLFAKAIPQIGAGTSAIIMTAELPVAICCAHLILGEEISKVQWAGIIIMLLAIIWMNRQKNKPGLLT
ncbi:EamA/RhaT family transporter [Paraflavitalea soli]|uniref:EamA/RhaT family transporter n=1 Tax=Paraflavitalea soli TaxID=2315862 RepID=A0A3B7MS10_9BACT|nr:DMT family transporter [Paraflavitalea soli]AXY74405.1 EamA/RhaT family transporter [Paraflavitalea soli]